MPGPSGNSESKNGKGRSLRVLQLTDTHFFGNSDGRLMGVDTFDTFRQVLKLATERRGTPDFYLLTGDLSQDETQLSYERFADAVNDMHAPAYYLPGNHDARELMETAFGQIGGPFRNDRNFTVDNWNVILLDTQVEGEVGGHLDKDELKRLDTALARHPDKHALVTLHHHPLPVGSQWIDSIKVDNSDEFLEVIDKYPQVRMVLCGHIHQEFETKRGSVRFLGTPSTCVQFKPGSSSFAVDVVPPGFRWLQLNPDGTIETGVIRVQAVARGLDLASLGY
jgi:Icc protein